jgi:hypothetical protein
MCTRRVLNDAGAVDEGVKLVTIFRRQPSCFEAAFEEALSGEYAELVASINPLRHEQLWPDAASHGSGSPPDFDAVDALWFETPEQAAAVPARLGEDLLSVVTGRVMGVERLVARPVLLR